MTYPELLLALLFLLVLVVASASIIRWVRRSHDKFLSEALPTHDGTPFRVRYFRASEGSPSSLTATITSRSSGSFTVTRERPVDRLAKEVGLSRDIQTGDLLFDRDSYIDTETPDVALAVFMSPEKRESVRELFRLGVTSVKHNGKAMEAEWSPSPVSTEDPNLPLVRAAVPHLVTLAKDLPIELHPTTVRGRTPAKAKTLAAAAIMIAAFLVFVSGCVSSWAAWDSTPAGLLGFEQLDQGRVFLDSLKYSPPACLLFIVLAVGVIKGRSSAHKEMGAILLFSVVGFTLGGFGFTVLFNVWLDRSPAVAHTVLVTSKWISGGETRDYHLTVRSWRRKGERETFAVPRYLYEQITPKRTKMIILTKPGRFGYEWAAGYSIAGQQSRETSGQIPFSVDEHRTRARRQGGRDQVPVQVEARVA